MQSRVASIGFIFGALTLLGGCELIASVDRSLLDENTGGGGNPTTGGGGAGATGGGGNGGTGGTGGVGGTGGTGGTGGGGGCEAPEECPTPAVCKTRDCDAGSCVVGDEPADTACTDGALTGVCDGAGDCVECLGDDDCTLPATCDLGTNVCVAPGCMNLVMDNDETDVDCGGGCNPCMNMQDCGVDGDCVSGFCNGTTCEACTGPADCDAAEFCAAGVCTPDLVNGAACTTATGDATGNSQCPANQCNEIGDGTKMCCSTDCSGGCRSCAFNDTGTVNGTCADITSGTDPKDSCTGMGCATIGTCQAGVCGSVPDGMDPNGFCAANECVTTGTCQGAACEPVAAGTNCGDAPTCVGDQLSPQDTCGGATCNAGTLMSCALYSCNAAASPDACFTACSAQNQCAAGSYCILLTAAGTQMTCADKKAAGACNENFECEDSTCTANVCEGA